MKIGLISFHSFAKPGGVKRHILELKDELKKRGIEVKVIVPRRKRSEDYGKDVILLGTSLPLSFSGSQADLDINFNHLAIDGVLEKEKFDILHFHNFGFPSAFQILEKSRSLNILTFHANIEESKFFKRFPLGLTFFNLLVKWKMHGIIGVNPRFLQLFKGYKGPITVIPNGIDLNSFNLNVPKLKEFVDDKVNILFLGRIEERKGLIYLLRAYRLLSKSHNNLRLIVVGDGPEKQNCKEYVRKHQLKEVVFLGGVGEKDVPPYYRTADIFCAPATHGESFGIVLVEAMASGIPVVAFSNNGYKTVINQGKGKEFLVEPRDYRALAQKLDLLIRDEKLRKEMGGWGLQESKKYAWPIVADQVLDFYKLCKRKKS